MSRSAEVSASCLTGAAVIALTNPLDCLKQRWQVEQSIGSARGGLFSFTRQILREEGLFRGLWTPGIGSNTVACTCSVGARLGLYPLLRDSLALPGSKASGTSMFLSGLTGGALGYIVGAPFFCAARMAQAEAGALDATGQHYVTGARKGHPPTVRGGNGGLGMLSHIARTQGVVGLWRGSTVLVARGAIMSATQLATYDLTKVRLRALGLADGPVMHSAASLVASLTLTTAICPLDVTYTYYTCGGMLGRSFDSPLACGRALLQEGGPAALLRGWVPLWARFLPSSFLTFHIYEQSRKLLLGKYLD